MSVNTVTARPASNSRPLYDRFRSQVDWNTGMKLSYKPWLIVFDLDGTLIDSSSDLCASVNAALMAVCRAPLPHGEITGFVGDGAATLVRRALARSSPLDQTHSQSDEVIFASCFRLFLDLYRAHMLDTTRPYPGVQESLAEIRRCHPDLLMAVLTNKPVKPSSELCQALGLSPYFFANYGGDSFSTKKPEPEGLQHILDDARCTLLGRGMARDALPSHEAVMVGDSGVDIAVGHACGMSTLGCSYGLAREAVFAARPHCVVDHARDWPQALGCLPERASILQVF